MSVWAAKSYAGSYRGRMVAKPGPRMAEIIEDDKVTFKEEISTAEDTCTVFVVGEDVKKEITENQGEVVKIEEKRLKKKKLREKREKSGKSSHLNTHN
ncbi:uncharacterized protein LOC111698173 isoform X2 [Eurytemora carolleeae]|uniref:uncharacterized protein LOC111698173 isoform X2 n=1 Tax=Eurytemora carolleeae TaxID=1294199 RepID=UPI000C77430D|nr:uncharacterized protein LOC111698173 isoform X2 [Eurytemora carolleeae]|eukprot:XP_023324201.1 uncharacterized protein LOC111698173 isoform X2 [Eurytemora affinis]